MWLAILCLLGLLAIVQGVSQHALLFTISVRTLITSLRLLNLNSLKLIGVGSTEVIAFSILLVHLSVADSIVSSSNDLGLLQTNCDAAKDNLFLKARMSASVQFLCIIVPKRCRLTGIHKIIPRQRMPMSKKNAVLWLKI